MSADAVMGIKPLEAYTREDLMKEVVILRSLYGECKSRLLDLQESLHNLTYELPFIPEEFNFSKVPGTDTVWNLGDTHRLHRVNDHLWHLGWIGTDYAVALRLYNSRDAEWAFKVLGVMGEKPTEEHQFSIDNQQLNDNGKSTEDFKEA